MSFALEPQPHPPSASRSGNTQGPVGKTEDCTMSPSSTVTPPAPHPLDRLSTHPAPLFPLALS
ncbi:hypothetical protein FA13DRAFT_48128 [Coprinellus micaceus]|uniref:Uncharacterized protein n=1 Tax=Coprinellus micaceus TaxID=71717 RepID=A0A4Y7U0S4_COPMI|nr:hypothetical protein FA13DRAFT_48128 [Coprinellus micaceus]